MKLVNGEVVNRRPPNIGLNRDNFRSRPRARNDARTNADFFGFNEATSLDIQRMFVGRFENRAIIEAQFTRPDGGAHADVGDFLRRDFAGLLVLRENQVADFDLFDWFGCAIGHPNRCTRDETAALLEFFRRFGSISVAVGQKTFAVFD